MISHLQIQYALGGSVATVMVVLHFSTRVIPGWSAPWSAFDPQRALPYVAATAAGVCLRWFALRKGAAYEEFVRNSPGVEIDTGDIAYGVGHGFRARAERSRPL